MNRAIFGARQFHLKTLLKDLKKLEPIHEMGSLTFSLGILLTFKLKIYRKKLK